MKTCLNCGNEVRAGTYCEFCGQRNVHGRLQFHDLMQDIREQFFEMNLPWLFTIRNLTFRPGDVCREFVAGKRIRYVNPLKYFFYMAALVTLLFQLLPQEFRTITTPVQGSMYLSFTWFQRLVYDNPILLNLYGCFLTALFMRILIPRTEFNKTEINSALLFIFGHVLLLSFLIQFVSLALFEGLLVRLLQINLKNTFLFPLFLQVSLIGIYCVLAFKSFFRTRLVSALAKTLALFLFFAFATGLTREAILYL